MSKILANQIANYGDDAPIEIKEGLNIPTGKPIQAAGVSGTSGQVLTSTGSTISWTTPFDGDYNSLTNLPTIPAAQVNSDWNATSGVSRILNKPVIPPLPSVTTNAAGTAALSYNSVNGQFTYTPPDLSGYATTASVANSGNWDTAYGWGDHASEGYLVATATDKANWNSAYGWGNHATQGYLTSYTETTTLQDAISRDNTSSLPAYFTNKLYFSNAFDTLTDLQAVNATTYHGMFAHAHDTGHGYFAHAGGWTQLIDGASSIDELGDVDTTTIAPSDGYVLKWEASSSSWKPAPDLVGTSNAGITLVDLSVNTATASATPSLSYSNTTGVFTYTPYDPSTYTETDPVFSASAASTILGTNISNWDTAYGWGNHATEGYLQDSDFTANGFMKRTGNGTYVVDTNVYLTSYTETDPVFSASVASSITSTDTSNWNTAYGWGDHASGGYLTTVALNDVSDVTITSPTSGQVLSYNGSAWVNTAAATGNTQVTISDTLPAGTPSAGDLWWESDTGRLKIYYQDVDGAQWVDTNPPLADTNNPAAKGFINMNGSSPTWTGTAGYTVAHSGGGGSDEVYTLTFPSAYGARTDYIVNADYDGTNWVAGNGAQLGIVRNAGNVQITVRRWNEDPLNQGEIMITIHNL